MKKYRINPMVAEGEAMSNYLLFNAIFTIFQPYFSEHIHLIYYNLTSNCELRRI